MTEIIPDIWTVIEFGHEDQVGTIRKVLAGFQGGLDTGNKWMLGTEIRKTVEQGDTYEFTTNAGNLCICYKDRERVDLFPSSLFKQFRQDLREGGWLQIVEYGVVDQSTRPDDFKLLRLEKEKPGPDPAATTEPNLTFTEKIKAAFSLFKK